MPKTGQVLVPLEKARISYGMKTSSCSVFGTTRRKKTVSVVIFTWTCTQELASTAMPPNSPYNQDSHRRMARDDIRQRRWYATSASLLRISPPSSSMARLSHFSTNTNKKTTICQAGPGILGFTAHTRFETLSKLPAKCWRIGVGRQVH